MSTRKKVERLQTKTGSLAGRGSSRKSQEVLDEIELLLPKYLLTEWTSFLEKMYGGHGVVTESLYSIFTVKPLHNLHLGL